MRAVSTTAFVCPPKLLNLEWLRRGSCPIITKTHSLPANPFYANVEGGKCKCLPPQKCDGDGA